MNFFYSIIDNVDSLGFCSLYKIEIINGIAAKFILFRKF